ncbi:MAG: hypothetical protein ACJ77Z_10935 [Thermoleophilaceae bacterium]
MAELRERGVIFDELDAPGLDVVDGVVQVGRNYPSKGTGERGAFFRDSEGNVLGARGPRPRRPTRRINKRRHSRRMTR